MNKSPSIISRMSQFFKSNGYSLLDFKEGDTKIVLIDDEGNEHSIIVGANSETSGVIATSSIWAAEALSNFTEQELGKDQAIFSRVRTMKADDEESKKKLKELINGNPEAIAQFIKDNPIPVLSDSGDIDLKKAEEAIEKLEFTAKMTNNKEALKKVASLKALLKITKSVVKTADEDKKDNSSAGQKAFNRLRDNGDTLPPCRMQDVKVGQKFFDEANNLLVAVGFAQGYVTSDSVNCVVIKSNSNDFYDGLPVTKNLNDTVVITRL